ncbi:hypothetical protein DFP73DRAFT_544732 [Morchella snyderi]|nr:hypothetical protein DFP73DRAFT_544732 [Morchella snyderi]
MRSRKPTATGEGDAEKAPKTKRGRPSSKKITEEATGSEKAPAKRDSPAAVTAKKLAPKRTRAKPTVQDEEEELEVDTPPAYSLPLPLAVITPDGDNELLDIPNKKSPEELKVFSQPSAKPTPTKDKDGSESELSDVSEEPPKRKGKRTLIARPDSPKKKAKPSPKPAEIIEGPGKDFKTILQDRSMPSLDADVDDAGAGSDSEMSIVLDPTPQKGRSSITKVPPPKKTKASKAPAKKGKAKKSDPSTKLDPEQEQLKSLKAWLLKCGIRRIWTRELAKFETPREQIAHLKGILTDIGMTGRYSADKAKKIKAKRELKAELEAIQVNAGSWGMEEKNTAEDVGRSRRRSGGRKARIVIDDEDEEEVDAGGNIVRAREKEMEDLAFMDGHSESE